MTGKNEKSDYLAKLKSYLSTPSDTMPLYEQYSEDNTDAKFEDYTRELEELLAKMQAGKFKNHKDLCAEVVRLKLPHNQFDCEE
jgi:hypothetical protein